MKGLLIKDWQLLKNQKAFFMVLAVIMVLYTAMGNVTFLLSYAPMMCVFVAMSTITYDTFDNGSAFLFTLPFSRKEYVREKYIFSGLLVLISWGISVAAALGHTFFRAGDWKETLVTSVIFLLLSLIIMSLSIPLQLKYGAEKSRVAVMIMMGAAFGLLFVVFKIMDARKVNTNQLWSAFHGLNTTVAVAAAIAVCTALIGISLAVSTKIMHKKEL